VQLDGFRMERPVVRQQAPSSRAYNSANRSMPAVEPGRQPEGMLLVTLM